MTEKQQEAINYLKQNKDVFKMTYFSKNTKVSDAAISRLINDMDYSVSSERLDTLVKIVNKLKKRLS